MSGQRYAPEFKDEVVNLTGHFRPRAGLDYFKVDATQALSSGTVC